MGERELTISIDPVLRRRLDLFLALVGIAVSALVFAVLAAVFDIGVALVAALVVWIAGTMKYLAYTQRDYERGADDAS